MQNLSGQWIELLTLDESHREDLRALSFDESIWRYMPKSAAGKEFDAWFDKALTEQASGEQIPWVVKHKSTQKLVGSTRYYNIVPEHKRLHIGYTWYSADVRGTKVNPEAKLLLLQHAFEILEINRVEICADTRNMQSCAAIKKLGAVEEGILRQHMIVHGDYVRDTAVFSIIKTDWPQVKENLMLRLMTACRAD